MNGEAGFFDEMLKHQTGAADTGAAADDDLSADDANAPARAGEDDELQVPATSVMHPDARRALVILLRQGVVLASKNAKVFESIARYQLDIRQHLSNVYLKLVLDEKFGVCFVASVGEEDADMDNEANDEAVSLIPRRVLSLFDTLLLIVLRKHYQTREASGEHKVIIDIETIESDLIPFLPQTGSTALDRKKLNGALQRMSDRRLLVSVRGSEDRFEITPVIRYVVSADFLDKLHEEYLQLGREAGVSMQGHAGQDEDQEVGE
ncbi:MAG: DUF4194 domain-containing protein [Thiogranum sp.]|nr:DUF4194 domain-containing protein [Thiogranum sp.]